ncbi:MAG TPA: hypothetical protein VEQ60_14075 [Longimicrobium sp.]|nr:hypothetical protein [Longimicrobium sp.]
METGQVLPSFLADEQQGRVFAKRGERAEELLNLVKLGDRDFVDLHFPFIVEPERPLPSQNALADALGAVFREAYSQAGRPNKISLHKRITVNSLIQATTKFDREDENVMGHPDGLHTEIRDRLLGKRRSAAIEAIENTNPATGKTRNQQKNYFRKPKAKEKTNSGREQVGKKLKPNPHASKGK